MRPIKLELEGFTVYRERTQIDFSNLDFFIILGKTGSGKTSIIDAMCYALYGRVPRHTKQSVHEKVLSKGSRKLYVKFEFSVKNKGYTIERLYIKDTKGGRSQIKLFQNGRPLNLSAKEIEDKVVDILGMDYDTFTRVIVLPQGQFDRFLKPHEAKERRETLNKLLGYDKLFEAISEHLKRKYDKISKDLTIANERMTFYKNYTPEQLQTYKLEKDKLEKEKEQIEREISILKKNKEVLDSLASYYADLQKKLEEYNSLKAQEELYKREKERLNLAKEALEYKPIWQYYQEKERKIREKEEEKKNIYNSLSILRSDLEKAKQHLEELKKKYSELPIKRERLNYLSVLIERLKTLQDEEKKLNQLNESVEKLRADESQWSAKVEHLKNRVRRGEEEIKKLKEEIKQLEEIRESLRNVQSLKDDALKVTKIEDEIGKINQTVEKLEKDLNQVSNVRLLKQQELLKAHTVQIKLNLKLGDRCPVCGSRIESLPHVEESLDFEKIKAELKQIEASEREILSKMQNYKGQLELNRRELQNIKDKLGPYEPREVLQMYEEWERVEKTLKDLNRKLENYQNKWEELRQDLYEATQKLTQIQTERNQKENFSMDILYKLQMEKRDLSQDLGLDPKDLDLETQLNVAVLEKKLLDMEIREIEGNYEKVTEKVNNLEKQKEVKEETYRKLLEDIEQLKKEKSEKSVQIYEIIKKYGSVENLEAMLLDGEELGKLERRVNEYEKKLYILEDSIKDLQLKTKDYSPDTHMDIRRKLKDLEEIYEEKIKDIGHIEKVIEETAHHMEEYKKLKVELEELSKSKNLYEALKKDFESNRFPDYASKSMLSLIIQRANVYLIELSNGLYRFTLREGNLLIHDASINAERDVFTLSGGETFLASLSLAFGVAEVVSHGAIIESIFIDEGFGSLDRETRESLGEFFELIKRNSQKMVGVISHLEDLREKFDQRIEIHKKGNTAHLHVVSPYGGADGT